MKILARALKKEDISLVKGYRQWYRVIDNELRLFINEDRMDENGQLANIIDWKNNIARLCISSKEYNIKFYEKYKHLKVRLYVREDNKSLYNELSVKDWRLSEEGIILELH